MRLYRFRVLAIYDIEAKTMREAEAILASALPPHDENDPIEWVEGEIDLITQSSN